MKSLILIILLGLPVILTAQTEVKIPKFETKILFMQVWDGSNTTYSPGIFIEDGNFGEFTIELERVTGKKAIIANAKVIANVFNQLEEQGYYLSGKFGYNADVTGNVFVGERDSYIFKKQE